MAVNDGEKVFELALRRDERRRTGEKLVEETPKRVQVRSIVDVTIRLAGLLGREVEKEGVRVIVQFE